MGLINDMYEQMVYLCEIRGELDPETNSRTEQKIGELQAKIAETEANLYAADPRSHGPDQDA
jgi:hypothetical protein